MRTLALSILTAIACVPCAEAQMSSELTKVSAADDASEESLADDAEEVAESSDDDAGTSDLFTVALEIPENYVLLQDKMSGAARIRAWSIPKDAKASTLILSELQIEAGHDKDAVHAGLEGHKRGMREGGCPDAKFEVKASGPEAGAQIGVMTFHCPAKKGSDGQVGALKFLAKNGKVAGVSRLWSYNETAEPDFKAIEAWMAQLTDVTLCGDDDERPGCSN